MMKKFLLVLWTMFCLSIGMFAQNETGPATHVSAEKALNIGFTFMQANQPASPAPQKGNNAGMKAPTAASSSRNAMQVVYTGRATDSLTRAVTDCYYVIALQPKGFVIVAADERANPILAYSYDNNFDPKDMPVQVREWLGNYEQEIKTMIDYNLTPSAATEAEWAALKAGYALPTRSSSDTVGPLITTRWDQAPYYNALCPEDANGPDGHAYTGCVATAMAQIINYWQYPTHGRGTHSHTSNYGELTVDYNNATYDYAHMPTALTSTSTADEVNAVATLMFHCGVAANMGYGPTESGSYDADARAGLINFFRYSPNINYVEKSNFSNAKWKALLREQLVAHQPIIYSGRGTGGHTFICDGYNADDYFHFNFGWSGNGNGWFLTSAINPGSHEYSSSQTALIGIVPDTTGHIILGQMAGTSTFSVDEPLEFYHLMGHNDYTGTDYNNNCNNTVVFTSTDLTTTLVLDVISFDNQNVTVYDSISSNQLANLTSNTTISSVVSTTPTMTLLYNGRWYYDGFHLNISQNNGCRMVSNLTTSVDTTTVHLTWNENGNATQWQVEYGLKGFRHGEGTIKTVNTNSTDIMGLTSFREYDFYVRPICGTNQYGPWRQTTEMALARYWTDVVTSQPEGYVEDEDGNITISSAEGLAWFSTVAQNDNFAGRRIYLSTDINLGKYLWKPIGLRDVNSGGQGHDFCGTFDGLGHTIDSMHSITMWWSGLFGNIANATIKNISLTNLHSKTLGYIPNWSSSHATGLGAGALHSQTTIIMNCFVSGKIEGEGEIAPILYYGNGAYIINCASNCEIIGGKAHVGGIVSDGFNGGGECLVRNCYSASNITSKASWESLVLGYGEYALAENCYGYLAHKNKLSLVQGKKSTFRDLEWFDESNDGFSLVNPIFFETDSQYHSNLKDVLNEGVKKFNLSGLRIWIDDTLGINEGMPILGPEYMVTCPNIQNLTARNVTNKNGDYGVELSWTEMGDATAWEIEYHKIDSSNTVRTTTSTRPDTIWGLMESTTYVFRIRPKCSTTNFGGWSDEISYVFDRPCWTDVITFQPDGYSIDDNGNVTISTAEGLAWLISTVNGLNGQKANNFEGKNVVLTENVNVGRYRWTALNGFSGKFDGLNKTIIGLYINSLDNNQGLFGTVNGGSYANIKIAGAYIKGNNYCGILLGDATDATIINCHTSGTVIGNGSVGGMIGRMHSGIGDPAYVNACSSSGSVHADDQGAGGLCGSMQGTLINSYSTCNVTSNTSFSTIGGLCGSSCNTINCYSTGNVTGRIFTGGLLGYGTRIISNCYSGSTVIGTGSICITDGNGVTLCGYRTGSFIGAYSSLTLSNCYGLADYEHHPFMGIGETNESVVQDTASFVFTGENTVLLDSIAVGKKYYNNLLDALNAWVDTYDTAGVFLHWVADTADVNGGFPMFEEIKYNTITLSVANSTPWGTVNGAGTYPNYETPIISAVPNYGYHFAQWNDGNTDNPRTINLTQDTAFIAIFEKDMFNIVGTSGAGINYNFDFENPARDYQWTLMNEDTVNRWYISTLDKTNRALFISYDNGIRNQYNSSSYPNSYPNIAFSTITLTAGQYKYSYNWRDNNSPHFKIALIPTSIQIPQSWNLPNQSMLLGAQNNYNLYAGEWLCDSGQINIPTTEEYNIWIFWETSSCCAIIPALAIDNIQFHSTIPSEMSYHGHVTGSDTVPYLDTVTLTAVAYDGYRFTQWHDGNKDNPRKVVATQDKYYIAMFECEPYNNTDTIVACGSYTWNNNVYNTSTDLVETFTAHNGCDSIVTHHLIINPVYNTPISVSICRSELPYHYVNGKIDTTFLENTPQFSTFNFQFSTSKGCDSIVTLQLTVNEPPTPRISGRTYLCTGGWTTLSASGGTKYQWSGESTSTVSTCRATKGGVYTVTVTNGYGCTATASITVTEYPLPNVIISGESAFCEGGSTELTASGANSYVWSNGDKTAATTISEAGSYTVTGTTSNIAKCSATATHIVTTNPTYNVPLSATICRNELPYHYVNGKIDTTFLESTLQLSVFNFQLSTSKGCDSIITLQLTVNDSPNVVISGESSFCEGGSTELTASGAISYEWSNGDKTAASIISKAGNYSVIGTDGNGCTNSASLLVSTNPIYNISLSETICRNELPYHYVNGKIDTTFLESTPPLSVFSFQLSTSKGCDSTITLQLTVNDLPNVIISGENEFCEGGSTELTASGATSYEWSNGDKTTALTVSEAGNYSVIGTDGNGCTKSATLLVSTNPIYNISLSETICHNELPYHYVNGKIDTTFLESTPQLSVFSFQLSTSKGCDSIVTLQLIVNDLPNVVISGESSFCEGGSTELTASGANSYVWSNGDKTAATTVSKADNYSVIGTDGNGCTNSATLLVSTNPIYNISLTETICRNELPYRYVNGKIDTTFLENTPQLSAFSFQFSTSKGCDSIITLQLTVIPTTYGDTAAIACETFSWYEYSTLTESGDYTHTLSNAAGCDSVVTLHLTINHNVYNEISAITADSCYIWNDSTYCQSGDYIQIFEADNNCDSIVTLHLLITVGINHYSQTNEIVVYPNPTTGMLTIRGDNMSLLQLTDVQGRLLQTWRASDRTMQINLSAYPTGLYLLRIHGNKQSWTYKIIKQ